MKTITHYLPLAFSRNFSLYVSVTTISLITLLSSISSVSANEQNNNASNINQEPKLKIQSVSQPKANVNLSERKTYWLENKTKLLINKEAQLKKNNVIEKLGASRESNLIAIKNKSTKKALNNLKAIVSSVVSSSASKVAGTSAYQNTYPEDFSIFDASSYLLDDIDGDGYYQSFSIVFDADYHPIYSTGSSTEQANVYAILYLSQSGGAWKQFHATDVFSIYSDSSDDEIEVFTTLDQGFTSDSFNVLIDLYYAGSDELVATYSSDDNNSLYALPLESVDYDQPYVVEVVHTDGGSSSTILLLLSTLILIFRMKNKTKPLGAVDL
jgi:hypothetical protein